MKKIIFAFVCLFFVCALYGQGIDGQKKKKSKSDEFPVKMVGNYFGGLGELNIKTHTSDYKQDGWIQAALEVSLKIGPKKFPFSLDVAGLYRSTERPTGTVALVFPLQKKAELELGFVSTLFSSIGEGSLTDIWRHYGTPTIEKIKGEEPGGNLRFGFGRFLFGMGAYVNNGKAETHFVVGYKHKKIEINLGVSYLNGRVNGVLGAQSPFLDATAYMDKDSLVTLWARGKTPILDIIVSRVFNRETGGSYGEFGLIKIIPIRKVKGLNVAGSISSSFQGTMDFRLWVFIKDFKF